MEGAPGRSVARARREARNRLELRAALGLGMRERVEKRARVGMPRLCEQLLRRTGLDDPPRVEDRDVVGDRAEDAEVVRDEDHREAVLTAKPIEEPEDSGLNGDVQRRRRLVRDQQLRPGGESAGDRNALAHPARELVREIKRPLGIGKAHLAEELLGARERCTLRRPFVVADVLGELSPDGHHRVERRQWVLEDHRELAAANLLQTAARERQQIPSREVARPLVRAPRGSSCRSASTDIVLPLPLSPATPRSAAPRPRSRPRPRS